MAARKTVADTLPREAFEDEEAAPTRYRDVEVVRRHDGTREPWPGAHRNVRVWWSLANGLAIGWNENTARGFSFPVVRHRI